MNIPISIYRETNFFLYLFTVIFVLRRDCSRRPFFPLRVAACVVAGAAIAYGLTVLVHLTGLYTAGYIFKYLCCFALVELSEFVCFDTKLKAAAYYGICGYAIQHSGYSVFRIAASAAELSGFALSSFSLLAIAVEFSIQAVWFAVFFLLFGRFFRGLPDEYDKTLFLPLVVLLVVTTGLDVIGYAHGGLDVRIMFSCYAILVCVSILYAMYKVNGIGELLYEKKAERLLSVMQNKQKDEFYKNIEYINIKCHDLRKSLELLSAEANGERLKEIENKIRIYDGAADTGNETLDVILTEKGMVCESDGIDLTFMADGKLLSFIDTMDICSLFYNILDNAIEATRKIEDGRKKLISLKVVRVADFLKIQCFNSCVARLHGDRFVTEKTNKRDHGFGLKSIRSIVESYGGDMKTHAENGIFEINVLIPLADGDGSSGARCTARGS